jgi:RNA polymerase sigma-70 factor (ECF subfamily)
MGSGAAGGASATADDATLVRRVAEADSAALRELYERHFRWLHARLMHRCNDREVVLDVLQDTFVALWRDAGRWRGDGDVAAWLWGIAFRRLATRLRRRRDVLLLPDWDEATTAGRTVPAAEEQVLLGIEYGDLAGALRQLSPQFRSVVQACILDGLSAREAGHLLGIRENTVRTRLHRAKQQLRVAVAASAPSEGWR